MMIAPAAHFSMGGLWVDYHLMSNLSGLFVLGEANFSDHGANRLGANSLLQACVDGYFIAPSTVMDYLAEVSSINSINNEYNNLELNIISFKDKYIKEIMDNQTLFNTCSKSSLPIK
jgi:succinate dehydrogenase / fumarate reductase flavoprotein subunit